MVRLAWLLTGGDGAAEELVQDAFLAVFRRWDDVRDPVGYLRRSVVNACMSHHRDRARRTRERMLVGDGVVGATGSDLRDVIASLPTRQRTAIVLRYYEDLTDAEIATAMGCRVPAVKSLLHRALRSLRKVVER